MASFYELMLFSIICGVFWIIGAFYFAIACYQPDILPILEYFIPCFVCLLGPCLNIFWGRVISQPDLLCVNLANFLFYFPMQCFAVGLVYLVFPEIARNVLTNAVRFLVSKTEKYLLLFYLTSVQTVLVHFFDQLRNYVNENARRRDIQNDQNVVEVFGPVNAQMELVGARDDIQDDTEEEPDD